MWQFFSGPGAPTDEAQLHRWLRAGISGADEDVEAPELTETLAALEAWLALPARQRQPVDFAQVVYDVLAELQVGTRDEHRRRDAELVGEMLTSCGLPTTSSWLDGATAHFRSGARFAVWHYVSLRRAGRQDAQRDLVIDPHAPWTRAALARLRSMAIGEGASRMTTNFICAMPLSQLTMASVGYSEMLRAAGSEQLSEEQLQLVERRALTVGTRYGRRLRGALHAWPDRSRDARPLLESAVRTRLADTLGAAH